MKKLYGLNITLCYEQDINKNETFGKLMIKKWIIYEQIVNSEKNTVIAGNLKIFWVDTLETAMLYFFKTHEGVAALIHDSFFG